MSTLPRWAALSLASGRPPLDRSLGSMAVARMAFRESGRRATGLFLRLGTGAHTLQGLRDDPRPGQGSRDPQSLAA